MTKIRAVVADDEKPARTLLIRLLRDEPDVELVGVASDGREAVEVIRKEAPDLVLLDIQMPAMDGFEVLRQITPQRMPCTIFVTAHNSFAIEAFEAHALDYLLKPFGGRAVSLGTRSRAPLLAVGGPVGSSDTNGRAAGVRS
jgi:two-component system LytT family response regulator